MESDPQRVEKYHDAIQSYLASLRGFWYGYLLQSGFHIQMITLFKNSSQIFLSNLLQEGMAHSEAFLLYLVRLPTCSTRVS